MPNRIRSLLGVRYPVVQAPMTYIARAELLPAAEIVRRTWTEIEAALDGARSRSS